MRSLGCNVREERLLGRHLLGDPRHGHVAYDGRRVVVFRAVPAAVRNAESGVFGRELRLNGAIQWNANKRDRDRDVLWRTASPCAQWRTTQGTKGTGRTTRAGPHASEHKHVLQCTRRHRWLAMRRSLVERSRFEGMC